MFLPVLVVILVSLQVVGANSIVDISKIKEDEIINSKETLPKAAHGDKNINSDKILLTENTGPEDETIDTNMPINTKDQDDNEHEDFDEPERFDEHGNFDEDGDFDEYGDEFEDMEPDEYMGEDDDIFHDNGDEDDEEL